MSKILKAWDVIRKRDKEYGGYLSWVLLPDGTFHQVRSIGVRDARDDAKANWPDTPLRPMKPLEPERWRP